MTLKGWMHYSVAITVLLALRAATQHTGHPTDGLGDEAQATSSTIAR